jgi:hypothetical protein
MNDVTTQMPPAEQRVLADRRRSTCALRWPERRSGFDRRRSYAVTKLLRDNLTVVIVLIVALNVLNLIDLGMTTRALSLGALEGNPIMAAAFSNGWEVAAAFKIGMMALISGAILLMRRYRNVLRLALVGLAGYTILVVYHFVGAAAIG